MEDKKCSHVIKHQSSSCSATLLASLATSPFEQRSKGEQSRVAEHATTCSACSAVLAQEQKLEEAMRAFSSPERYPDEPELNLLSVIQQARAQEYQAKNIKHQQKEHRQIWRTQHPPLLLVLLRKPIYAVVHQLLKAMARQNGERPFE